MDDLRHLHVAGRRVHSRCAWERCAKLQSGLTYTGLPAQMQKAQGITSGIGDPTYFGTDAPVPIMPVLTCNPTVNLVHYQRVNGNCFTAPPVGQQGGQNYPYMSARSLFQ